jgi:5-methylcytosine-specific restriction endonuclease McrA
VTLTRTPFARKRKPTADAYAAALDLITPALMERADYRCELQIPGVCLGTPLTRHHRKPRSLGGKNTMENVLILDGSGTTGCHGHVEANRTLSHLRGWLVYSWDDPAAIAIVTFREAM